MSKHDLAYWTKQAAGVESTANPLSVPYHVALQEAATTAAFVDSHWEPTTERPGLVSIRSRLPRATSDEIRTLLDAVQQVQTRLLLLVDPAVVNHGDRARFLVDELESVIDLTLDDDVHEEADDKLAQIQKFHSQDGQRSLTLAQALLSYGTLARELEDRVVATDEDFDPALIDEALALAKQMRAAGSAADATESPEIKATRTLRNRLLRLMQQRVGAVRRGAAYVYRRHPEELRKVTSAHERRRRAEARRARKPSGPTG